MLTRTCSIHRHSEDDDDFDEFGNPVVNDDATEDVPCEIQLIRTDEPPEEGEYARSTWYMWFPTGTQLDTSDEVELDGYIYALVGDVDEALSINQRWGFVEAVVARSRKVSGS